MPVPDLLASIPYEEIISLWEDTVGLRVASKLLRSLRILRLLRLGRVKERLEMQSTLKQASKMVIHFAVVGFVIAHVYACVWYALGHARYSGELATVGDTNRTTWLIINSDTIDPDNWVDTYVASLYWSFATMSTIGYGDIHAVNVFERVFSIFVMLTGTAVYAYGITSIFQVLNGPRQYQVRLMQQKDILSEYLGKMHVPRSLKRDLREYFIHYERSAMTFHERDMLSVLSPGLRTRVAALANETLLRAVPFFKDAEEGCIAAMVLELHPRLYVPAEVIIIQEHIGQELFIIKSGAVVIYLDKPSDDGLETTSLELAVLHEGNFFGEGVILKGAYARRGASAMAKVHSILYTLHCERVDAILVNYPTVRANIEQIARDRDAANAETVKKMPAERITRRCSERRSSETMDSDSPTPGGHSSPKGLRRALTRSWLAATAGDSARGASPTVLTSASPQSERFSVRRISNDAIRAAAGATDGAAAFRQWVDQRGLNEYQPAMAALGYDRLANLQALSPIAAEELAQHLGMKPGHAAAVRALAGGFTHGGAAEAQDHGAHGAPTEALQPSALEVFGVASMKSFQTVFPTSTSKDLGA